MPNENDNLPQATSDRPTPTFVLKFVNQELVVSVDEREAIFDLTITASGIDWGQFLLAEVQVVVNRFNVKKGITLQYDDGTPVEHGTTQWEAITLPFGMSSAEAQKATEEANHISALMESEEAGKWTEEKLAKATARIERLRLRSSEIVEITETKQVVVKTGFFAAVAIKESKKQPIPNVGSKLLELPEFNSAASGAYPIDAKVECIVRRIGGPVTSRYAANAINLKVQEEREIVEAAAQPPAGS